MPVELWLQCTCSATRPGDVLVAVGDHPAFGSWAPARSLAILETSPSSFPRWELAAPLVLEDEPNLECIVEYKYVVMDAHKLSRWEDLHRSEESATHEENIEMDYGLGFGDIGFDEAEPVRTGSFGKTFHAANRRLIVLGDSVVFRAEHFGQYEPAAVATWPVGPDWAPAVAGGSTLLGQGKRNSLNPDFELQYRFPRKLFVQSRRARLLAALGQMCDQRDLPPGLWARILDWISPDVASGHCSRPAGS